MMWRISHSGHHRIFDKYGVHPLTLAILGDTSRKWRPTSYRYQSLGCGITFHFRICKTIDFKDKLDDPRYRHQQATFIIAAHLGTQQHRRSPQKLSDYRLELTVKFCNEGYSPSEIHQLHRLIDWLMPLSDALKIQFRSQLQQSLPDTAMPHITLFEELALKEGRQEGRQEGLVEGLEKASSKPPARRLSTFSTPGSARCLIPCASGSTLSVANQRSRTYSVEQSALPASKNSNRLSDKCPGTKPRCWTVRHHPYRLPLPALAGHPGRLLPVTNESSRSTPSLGAFKESAPPFPPSPRQWRVQPFPCR
jgi:hypothetical protein